MNGIIKQPGVDTYNTGTNSLSSVYGLTSNNNGSNGKPKQNGWDVEVREDETKGGKSNRYNWNGEEWIDMNTGVYGDEIENKATYYNVTTSIPLPSGEYYTADTAWAAIPINDRKLGMTITYAMTANIWETQKFTGSNIESWELGVSWVNLSEIEFISAYPFFKYSPKEYWFRGISSFLKGGTNRSFNAENVDVDYQIYHTISNTTGAKRLLLFKDGIEIFRLERASEYNKVEKVTLDAFDFLIDFGALTFTSPRFRLNNICTYEVQMEDVPLVMNTYGDSIRDAVSQKFFTEVNDQNENKIVEYSIYTDRFTDAILYANIDKGTYTGDVNIRYFSIGEDNTLYIRFTDTLNSGYTTLLYVKEPFSSVKKFFIEEYNMTIFLVLDKDKIPIGTNNFVSITFVSNAYDDKIKYKSMNSQLREITDYKDLIIGRTTTVNNESVDVTYADNEAYAQINLMAGVKNLTLKGLKNGRYYLKIIPSASGTNVEHIYVEGFLTTIEGDVYPPLTSSLFLLYEVVVIADTAVVRVISGSNIKSEGNRAFALGNVDGVNAKFFSDSFFSTDKDITVRINGKITKDYTAYPYHSCIVFDTPPQVNDIIELETYCRFEEFDLNLDYTGLSISHNDYRLSGFDYTNGIDTSLLRQWNKTYMRWITGDDDWSECYPTIAEDPTGIMDKSVLLYHGAKNANQDSFRIQTDLIRDQRLSEVECIQDVYLSKGLNLLLNTDTNIGVGSVHWLTLNEFWSENNTPGRSFRITLGMLKDSVSDRFHFNVVGEDIDISTIIFNHKNYDFKPIVGEWFKMRTYLKYGDEDVGRFAVSIIHNGIETQIFDFTTRTFSQYYQNENSEFKPGGFHLLQFQKLYTARPFSDHIIDNGGKIEAMFCNYNVRGKHIFRT